MMDSTAYLVGSDAPHIELALQILSAGQCDMQEDNPVSAISNFSLPWYRPGSISLASPKTGDMPGVRHVRLQGDVRSR